jgi:hypothetical protein
MYVAKLMASFVFVYAELRPGDETTLLLPARFHIPAKWRILHPHRAFSVVHINMSSGPSVKGKYCLHQNKSLEPGSCVSWGARSGFLMKGLPRVETVSPFEPMILDMNTSAKALTGKQATVAVTEGMLHHGAWMGWWTCSVAEGSWNRLGG